MRHPWLWLALVAACGGRARPPELAPLADPAPPTALPSALGPEFTPPPSKPVGEPVAIAAFAPVVGLTRTHTSASTVTRRSSPQAATKREQITITHFELRERVLAVDAGHVTRLEVTTDTAEESLTLDGPPIVMPLLQGTYVVFTDTADPGAIKVERSGTPVYGREQEELDELYGGDIGVTHPLIALLGARSLRLGETVELTLADEQLLVPPDGAPDATIWLSLLSVEGAVATFQLNSTLSVPFAFGDGTDLETVGSKMVIRIDRTTGRLLRIDHVESRSQGGDLGDDSRSEIAIEYSY